MSNAIKAVFCGLSLCQSLSYQSDKLAVDSGDNLMDQLELVELVGLVDWLRYRSTCAKPNKSEQKKQ